MPRGSRSEKSCESNITRSLDADENNLNEAFFNFQSDRCPDTFSFCYNITQTQVFFGGIVWNMVVSTQVSLVCGSNLNPFASSGKTDDRLMLNGCRLLMLALSASLPSRLEFSGAKSRGSSTSSTAVGLSVKVPPDSLESFGTSRKFVGFIEISSLLFNDPTCGGESSIIFNFA